jgi:uncharacterized Ntn-hydrolase superfamily protein
MTFSIVGFLPDTGELGIAVSTARPAVGNRVPFVRFGVGAAATQASPNPLLGVRAVELLAQGLSVEKCLAEALRDEERVEVKQLLLVDARGNVAAYTGPQATPWSGHIIGQHFVAGANTMVGPQVVESMAAAYRAASGDLAERLVTALEAGQTAGGDRRGRVSAAVYVVKSIPAPYVDLRVDLHPDPVAELRRILDQCREVYPVLSLDPDVAAQAAKTRIWPK